ncbi:MAG: DUF4388 domain-containing protein [Thermoanaerobaculia bacterium]|nr:DUF4388 domain-containing protein [Thermoanaerobaculia bacterium]
MSTNQFEYQATLEETSIPEMFWTIYRHKVPGLIELSHEGIVKQIHVREGTIFHATSTDRSDRLGAHLYRKGQLTRDELTETMRERAATAKRHGALLIESGLLSPEQLYEAIRGQMEGIVWSVFSWQQGDVSFKIGEFQDPVMIRIHLPVRQTIVRGIKKVQDARLLVNRLGKKTTVFRPTYGTEDLIEIALDQEEYELLRLVDGQRTLVDICTEGPYSASENARLLYAFYVLHLIERVDAERTGQVKIKLDKGGG